MAIDVDRVIGAITRTLSVREKDGAEARVLVATRTYDVPRQELWDALTNAERIPRWFLPISGDLRLGGHFQFEGNAGGEIIACVPPSRFEVTWSMHGQPSWVTVELSELGASRTSLHFEHVAHVPAEMWQQFGPGAVGIGWDSGLLGLDQYFATHATVDPKTAAAWVATDEGKSFMRQSSDAWCAASIADGADPEIARAAADRIYAMYTGT